MNNPCPLLSAVLSMKKQQRHLSSEQQRVVPSTIHFPAAMWEVENDELLPPHLSSFPSPPIAAEGLDTKGGTVGIDRRHSAQMGGAGISMASLGKVPKGRNNNNNNNNNHAESAAASAQTTAGSSSSPIGTGTSAGGNNNNNRAVSVQSSVSPTVVKPFAMTTTCQEGTLVAAGYEDGSVIVYRLVDSGHNINNGNNSNNNNNNNNNNGTNMNNGTATAPAPGSFGGGATAPGTSVLFNGLSTTSGNGNISVNTNATLGNTLVFNGGACGLSEARDTDALSSFPLGPGQHQGPPQNLQPGWSTMSTISGPTNTRVGRSGGSPSIVSVGGAGGTAAAGSTWLTYLYTYEDLNTPLTDPQGRSSLSPLAHAGAAGSGHHPRGGSTHAHHATPGGAGGKSSTASEASSLDKTPQPVKAIHLIPHGPHHFILAVAYASWAMITVEPLDPNAALGVTSPFSPGSGISLVSPAPTMGTNVPPANSKDKPAGRRRVRISTEYLQWALQQLSNQERERDGLKPSDEAQGPTAGSGRRGSSSAMGGPNATAAGTNGAGGGAAKNRRGGGLSGTALTATNNTNTSFSIDNIVLSSCGRYVAVSLVSSPSLHVILAELPHLLPPPLTLPPTVVVASGAAGTANMNNGRTIHAPNSSNETRAGESPFLHAEPDEGNNSESLCPGMGAMVVEPERLLSGCRYTNEAVKHNVINGKTITEIAPVVAAVNAAAAAAAAAQASQQGHLPSTSTQGLSSKRASQVSPSNSPSFASNNVQNNNNNHQQGVGIQSPTSMGANGAKAPPPIPKLDVFSKCVFLRDHNGHAVQLVVVWVNSPKYARLPLRQPPSTFSERVKAVNFPAPPPSDSKEEGKSSGRRGGAGGKQDKQASSNNNNNNNNNNSNNNTKGKSKAGRSKGTSGQNDAASQRRDRSQQVLLYSGVHTCDAVAPIQVAVTSANHQLLALGCVGGSVHVMSVRRGLATVSAVPPAKEMPVEWQRLSVDVSVVYLNVQVLPAAASPHPNANAFPIGGGGGGVVCSASSASSASGLDAMTAGDIAGGGGGGGSASDVHVIVGTAMMAAEKPTIFGAASVFISLTDGTYQNSINGGINSRGNSNSNSAGLGRGPFDGSSTAVAAAPSSALARPLTLPALAPRSSGVGRASPRSFYWTGLPAPVNGALMADPLPFTLLFLDPYPVKLPQDNNNGVGGGLLGGGFGTVDSASGLSPLPAAPLQLLGSQRDTMMSSSMYSPSAGSASAGGVGHQSPSPHSGASVPQVKGAHHCLVWDTQFNALLSSLPFALFDDSTRLCKDYSQLPFAVVGGAGRGLGGGQLLTRAGSTSLTRLPAASGGNAAGLSAASVSVSRKERQKAERDAMDSMNTSMRFPGEEGHECAAAYEGRRLPIQNSRSSSHSVFHSIGAAGIGAGTEGIVNSHTVAAAMTMLPLTAASGGLFWLQNEEIAAPCAELMALQNAFGLVSRLGGKGPMGAAAEFSNSHSMRVGSANGTAEIHTNNNVNHNTSFALYHPGSASGVTTGSHAPFSGATSTMDALTAFQSDHYPYPYAGAGAGAGVVFVSSIRPYFWSFTALLHTLYPSFLAYFPDASLAQVGRLLHQLSPAERTDSVALMNASHDIHPPRTLAMDGTSAGAGGAPALSSGRRSPDRSRPSSSSHRQLALLGGGTSMVARGVSADSGYGQRHRSAGPTQAVAGNSGLNQPPVRPVTPGVHRQRRRSAASSSWVGRSGGAAAHVMLEEFNADEFPTKWLSSVSTSADVRRLRMNRTLDNITA